MLRALPGSGERTLLLYYATLALSPRGRSKEVVNASLKTHLVQSQVATGPQMGSWRRGALGRLWRAGL